MTQNLPIANVFSECDLWDRDKAEEVIDRVIFQFPSVVSEDLTDHIVNFILADDDFVKAYNKTYRHKDKPTNVLAFPYENNEYPPQNEVVILGDVYLAFETISREAAEQDKPFWDHVSHLTAHGFLHLLGYDHQTDEDAEIMEAIEVKILQELNIPDPYHEEAC